MAQLSSLTPQLLLSFNPRVNNTLVTRHATTLIISSESAMIQTWLLQFTIRFWLTAMTMLLMVKLQMRRRRRIRMRMVRIAVGCLSWLADDLHRFNTLLICSLALKKPLQCSSQACQHLFLSQAMARYTQSCKKELPSLYCDRKCLSTYLWGFYCC